MADPSFDVVSKVDRQEVDNALNQAAKEAATRYDFKGTGASIAWSGESIVIKADDRGALQGAARRLQGEAGQAPDLAQDARGRRARSSRARSTGSPATVNEGINQENAKKVAKVIRDEGPKGVQAQIQGDQLRVSAKKKDDLQAVIALLKGADFDFALQFTNYR